MDHSSRTSGCISPVVYKDDVSTDDNEFTIDDDPTSPASAASVEEVPIISNGPSNTSLHITTKDATDVLPMNDGPAKRTDASKTSVHSENRRISILETYHAEDAGLGKLIYFLDPYGVKPPTKIPIGERPHAHVCGCCANISRVVLMMLAIVYTVYLFLQCEYDVTQGVIMQEMEASLDSVIKPPLQGIYCCTENASLDLGGQDKCNSTGFIDFRFRQGMFLNQTKQPTRYLGARDCGSEFVGSETNAYTRCPLDSNYTIAGDFYSPTYAYLQSSVHSCPWKAGDSIREGSNCRTGPLVEAWVRSVMCVYIEEYEKHEVTKFVRGKVQYAHPIPTQIEQKSFRFHYVHESQQKVEMYHQVRFTEVDHWFMDIGALKEEKQDLLFKQMVPIYQYTKVDDWMKEPFLTFYTRIDRESMLAYLQPLTHVLGLLSQWGAFWALFSSSFGGVIAFANWRYYSPHVARQHRVTKSD